MISLFKIIADVQSIHDSKMKEKHTYIFAGINGPIHEEISVCRHYIILGICFFRFSHFGYLAVFFILRNNKGKVEFWNRTKGMHKHGYMNWKERIKQYIYY